MTQIRPPEAPDWIEAPLPWDGTTPPPVADVPPVVPAERPWGYRLLAGMLALGLVGSLAGGALSARLKSDNAASTAPSTVPFTPSAPQFTPPNAPATDGPSASSATVSTVGIVNINTSSTITNLRGAGTGMVLTASGEILTNNHVVEGATRIVVTIVDTGKTYTAQVVGVSPGDDVALLKLDNASGLDTIPLGTSKSVRIGDAVVSAGNAGGRGTPTVARGNVTALNQTIQVKDVLDDATETLRGLIQTSVPLQQGESGGPMFDEDGKVIGINTAASAGFRRGGAEGYAVPIDRALNVVRQIRTGVETDTIHIGVRGFLGVRTEAAPTGGARVVGVQSDSPADRADLRAGDVITAVDGESISDPSSLIKKIREHRPGETITLSWTTASGDAQSAKITLAKGAAG